MQRGAEKMNILIADDEIEIAEIVDFLIRDIFPGKVETFLVRNGKEGVDILKKEKIDICISDHNMPEGKGDLIFKHIKENQLETLFVLCSTEIADIYPENALYYYIQKPEIMKGVEELAKLVNRNFKSESSVVDIASEYIPVTLQFLLLIGKAPSDVYIRITDTKFLKCLNANEIFTIDDNAKYLSKSVSKLYVKKPSDQIVMHKLFSEVIGSIMQKAHLPLDERMAIAHSQLCGLIKFTGMSEDLAEITKENIKQTTQLIMKNNLLSNFWKEMNLKGEYPAQIYSLHSMLASVIVKKLSWSSESTLFKLTLAAFLQDVSLDTLPVMKIYDHHHFNEIKETLDDAEIKNFLEHPLKAKDHIAFFKEIPPDVDKIILEQHEMPDGLGFPRKLNANQLGPLSCVFILSGLLARYILNQKEHFQLAFFIEKFEAQGYAKGNFKEAFNVIRKML
jgi:response regulator RpfG family c-di-GMP phosphodiesterase